MFTRRKSTTYTVTTYRLHVVEEIDDKPSLPPFPIDVEGITVSDSTRPLRKCESARPSARRQAGGQ